MTTKEKASRIIRDITSLSSTDPIEIFHAMAAKDYISIHGPEHHILDGACILTAYRNAGGDIILEDALNTLMEEGLRMPGAMCGLWGICGAITSVGAALAIIDGTGPLSTDGTWGDHMMFTAAAVESLGRINGPRCCKRDGFLAIMSGIKYINLHDTVKLEQSSPRCIYSSANAQCIKEKCPFYSSPDSANS